MIGDDGRAIPDGRGVAPRSAWSLLSDPLFGPFFWGKLLASAGIWVFNIVAVIVAWDISHSTFTVGMVSVALFAPQLLLAPYSGAQADQRDPKAQLLAGRFLVMAGSGVFAFVIAIVGTESLPGAWTIIAVAAVIGTGFVVGGPAQLSLLPALVRPTELARAVALNSLPSTAALAGGPVLGVSLMAALGPEGAFAFTCLSNLVFAAVITRLPLGGRVERATQGNGTVRAGLTYLRGQRSVAYLILGMMAVGVGADPVLTLSPALSSVFGAGERLVGIFASAFGVAAALGYFALGRLLSRWGAPALSLTGLAFIGSGMVATGIAPTVSLAVGGLAMAGVGLAWSLTGLTTRLYEQVPEYFRGRMMALWSIAYVGSRPISAATSGWIADEWSVRLAFVVVGIGVGVLTVILALGQHRSPDCLDATP